MADLRSSSVWAPWLRVLALAGCLVFLLGGTCTTRHDDDDFCDDDDSSFDDDCDDDFDDDDDVIIIITEDGAPAPDPWRIADYRLEVDERTGERFLRDVHGVSLFDALGPGDRGPSDFAAFALQVWERNPDHLGPPRESGERVGVHAVRSDPEGLVVVLRQVAPDGQVRRPAADLELVFDGLGRLIAASDDSRDPAEEPPFPQPGNAPPVLDAADR